MNLEKILKQFDELSNWTTKGKKGGMMAGFIPEHGGLLVPEDVKSFLTTSITALLEEVAGEIGKKKKDWKSDEYNDAMDTAIEILRSKIK